MEGAAMKKRIDVQSALVVRGLLSFELRFHMARCQGCCMAWRIEPTAVHESTAAASGSLSLSDV